MSEKPQQECYFEIGQWDWFQISDFQTSLDTLGLILNSNDLLILVECTISCRSTGIKKILGREWSIFFVVIIIAYMMVVVVAVVMVSSATQYWYSTKRRDKDTDVQNMRQCRA